MCVGAVLDGLEWVLPPNPSKDCSAAFGCGDDSTSATKTELILEPGGNFKDRSAALVFGIHVQLFNKVLKQRFLANLA